MCGIFAYLNCGVPKTRKEIVEKLLVGLKRLEYRGYDSAGFAVDESDEEGDEDAVDELEAGVRPARQPVQQPALHMRRLVARAARVDVTRRNLQPLEQAEGGGGEGDADGGGGDGIGDVGGGGGR